MKQQCQKCQRVLEVEQFHWKKKKENKRHFYCKDCQNRYRRNHYRRNRKKYIQQTFIRNEKKRIDYSDKIIKYLLQHPCVNCGETNILVLEFSHRNRNNKFKSVSQLIRLGYAWETIYKEIGRCDIRCANCHKIITAKECNSLKYRYILKKGLLAWLKSRAPS